MGCRGPTTYNSCGNIRWYNGLSYPIQSGHGCIGCSADGFWDNGDFYSREQNIPSIGTESNADKVGAVAVGAAAAGAIAHGVISKIRSGKKED
jgi:hydrogenase small subunit